MANKKQIAKNRGKVNQKKNMNNNINLILGVVAVAVVSVVIYATIFSEQKSVVTNDGVVESTSENTSKKKKENEVIKDAVDEKGDLVINTADIGEDPKFYSYNELDNEMQVIAVKAADGTIRTAFNTCQVCYSSGRGYYEPVSDGLVCQNCKNRFGFDDVEVTRGGCNPVPIDKDNKTVNGTSIIIEKAFFEKTKEIFANWK